MSPSWTVRGPLTLTGAALVTPDGDSAPILQVTVIQNPNKYSSETILSCNMHFSNQSGNHLTQFTNSAGHALVDAKTYASLGFNLNKHSIGFLCLEDGSDTVLSVCTADNIPPACVALTPSQQHGWHVKPGSCVSLMRFTAPTGHRAIDLDDLELEVVLLDGSRGSHLTLDGRHLIGHFLSAYIGLIVAVNDLCVFPLGSDSAEDSTQSVNPDVVLRVVACNTLPEGTRLDTVGYHCYRGIVRPETIIYISQGSMNDDNGQDQAQSRIAGRRSFTLVNPKIRPPSDISAKTRIINVLTSDGEWFPVHKTLLRPCIALTGAIRTQAAGVEVGINVDTCTFDRVLLFLESRALGKAPPAFGVHLLPDLLQASRCLGLGALQSYCESRLGDAAARRRWHRLEEITRRNSAGECLLVMDQMVFDVTRWLPEHPGGDTIIPWQALNLDCSRFFEVYHASRESFLYLKEFYVGELVPGDVLKLPRPPEEPSEDFLMQLREYTRDFRLDGAAVKDPSKCVFKSF